MGGKSSQKTAGSVGLLHPASNGGFTQTERILKTSTAHDAIPRSVKLAGSSYCGGHDQRGVPRQQGSASHCDAGAYQFAPPVITGISPARGVPGTEVAIRGYGYDFLSLRFGNASPGFSVRNDVRITVATPKLGKGQYVISITNPDGKTSTKFQVLKPPKH
ncbi:MAG TPA: IPT/TIG domain-containing protein, partial [Chloroflexota bacterium]|nr:IPT/TIG domain-containing protein [Chloroflexota bacterium]